MNPYTHTALAIRFMSYLQPADPADYLWGAVVPDIRYEAGLPRERTHRPLHEIAGWADEFPELSSFVLGYRLHCLLDHIDQARLIGRAFPLNLLRRFGMLSLQPASVLIELYFIRTASIDQPISGNNNAILTRLGVTDAACAQMSGALRRQFAHPSLENAAAAIQTLAPADQAKMDRFIKAAQTLQNNRLLTAVLLWGVKNAHVEQAAEILVK